MYRIRRCAEIFSVWPNSLSQSETLLGWAENFSVSGLIKKKKINKNIWMEHLFSQIFKIDLFQFNKRLSLIFN